MGSFEIVVTRLSDGQHSYAFEAPGAEIGLSAIFQDRVRVAARLDRRGRQFFVEADVSANVHVVCDRCLRSFDRNLEGAYNVLYVADGATGDEEEEVRTIAIDAQLIELDDDVRQTLELAVPRKLLCKEDCRGLCPTCGKDLNDGPCSCERETIDPRWEPLRTLTRKSGKER